MHWELGITEKKTEEKCVPRVSNKHAAMVEVQHASMCEDWEERKIKIEP